MILEKDNEVGGVLSDDAWLNAGARVLVAVSADAEAQEIAAALEAVGHSAYVALTGNDALRSMRRDDPEAAVLDLSLQQPNAYQVCERIKAHPSTRHIPVILLVQPGATEERLRGLEVGADDFLSLPVNRLDLQARIRSIVRMKRLNEQAHTTENVIFGLAQLLERKAETLGGNPERVAKYAVMLGEAVGLPEEDLEILHKGAALHDIGKLAVREGVLLKNDRLSPEEYSEIQSHAEVGERLCGPLGYADLLLPLIRYHRERWDGKGYPDGLHGLQIPLLARILSVADAYVAMLSPRPYRPAMPPERAQATLHEGAGAQWDPELVTLFLDELAKRGLAPL